MLALFIDVILPLTLGFIMFSLGLGLTAGDFARVLQRPKAVLTGAVSQMVVIPVFAFVLLHLAPLEPELAVGLMILAFCPGGVTTNMLTKIGGGDVALSVTLTAAISLIAVITVPPLVALSAKYFMGEAAPEISVSALAVAMFLITAVPVAIGMTIRALAPRLTDRIEPVIYRIAGAFFVLILVVAIAANWELVMRKMAVLGPLVVCMILGLMAIGFVLARLVGLGPGQARAISIETGIQNGTLGITVGSLIAGTAAAETSGFVVPSAVYGVLMYAVGVPVVWLLFRRGAASRGA